MTPYWNKCVEFLPMWMAPNLVTLIGLFFNLTSPHCAKAGLDTNDRCKVTLIPIG